MKIKTYGVGQRLDVCAQELRELDLPGSALVLPIPTTKDGIKVNGTDTTLEAVAESADKTDVIVGYGLPLWFKDKLDDKGCRIFDAESDEEFLCANAELTAIGTVGYILNNEKKAPSHLSFGIIGCGRIGKRLMRYLLFLGADVKVYTSSLTTRIELAESGIETRNSGGILDLSGVDILINTAPAQLIKDSDIPFLPKGIRVIDLAAGKYLANIPDAVKLSGVPEKYPISAGKLYALCIKRFLEGEGKK